MLLRIPRLVDPRYYQIATLTSLLLYGVWGLDFAIPLDQALVIVLTAQLTQFLCTKAGQLPRFDPRSALISGLSLCLLLRTNALWIAALGAMVTIASKFLLRWNGKHVFNPTNFGLVAMLLLTRGAWVSPGQWGSGAYLGFLLASLGGLVVHRSSRSDVTYGFIGFYLAIVFGRALWLGDPLAIPLHHVQSGAFLLFAFFMISDPKTTPDSRAGRILYAFLVAVGAACVHFVLYRPNGLLWSLVIFAMTVPFIDRLLPGIQYQWTRTAPGPGADEKGEKDETPLDIRSSRARRRVLAPIG